MRRLTILVVPFAFYVTLVAIQPKKMIQKPTAQISSEKNQVAILNLSKHYQPIYRTYKKLSEKRIHQEFIASELQCLADNVYQEAAFEPEEGQLAVAIVTMNRVHDPEYPKTICGVVYERHLNPHNHKMTCQFSWTCKHRNQIVHSKYLEAREVARKAFLKHVQVAELEGVTLYHASYIDTPDWAARSQYVTKIGQHVFYK
jgi:spore germination cell wall hydrolase CwlJ-like protein